MREKRREQGINLTLNSLRRLVIDLWDGRKSCSFECIMRLIPTRCSHQTSTREGLSVPFGRQSPWELVIFCVSPGAGKSTFYYIVHQALYRAFVNKPLAEPQDASQA
jgi:hypothetical protein